MFTREAVSEIHKRSGGVPRTVSVIADNALLGGYAAGRSPCAAAIVREVCRDLDLPEPPRERRPQTAGRGGFRRRTATGRSSRSADGGREFRMLRARVSLPSEADDRRPRAAAEPKTAVAGEQAACSAAFMKKRRFFFFRR